MFIRSFLFYCAFLAFVEVLSALRFNDIEHPCYNPALDKDVKHVRCVNNHFLIWANSLASLLLTWEIGPVAFVTNFLF